MEKSDNLRNIISEILVNRFPDDINKQKIDENFKGYKIACPYCGDSIDDSSKKRGNIYVNTNSFKCFNDGCYKFVPISKFIVDFALQYNIDINDLDLTNVTTEWHKSNIKLYEYKNNPILEHLKEIGDYDKLLNYDKFIEMFGLIHILQNDAIAANIYDFINKRKLNYGFYYSNLFCDLNMDKLYFINWDATTGKVLSIVYRSINTKKFRIFTYDTLMEMGYINIDFSDIEFISTIGNYYNILNVDFNKTVNTTEAQIDSHFLTNSIAITGVDKIDYLQEILPKYKFDLVLDSDKAGKLKMLSEVKHNYGFLMWSKIKEFLVKLNYKNFKKINKIKDINDLFIYLLEEYPDMNIYDFNKMINKFISHNDLDMFYI